MARRRRASAGRDRLDILAPGLTEMAVHVDKPRRHDGVRAVDNFGVVRNAGSRSGMRDLAIDDDHIPDRVEPLRRVDDPAPMRYERSGHRSPPGVDLAVSASSGRPPASR